MTKFPQIKWYQNDTQIIITILQIGLNPILKKNDSFLNYNDSIYQFNLELFDNFIINNSYENKNNFQIILDKNNNNEWNSLLKNNKLYKYFISLEWDKYINNIKANEPIYNKEETIFDEEEFNYLLKSGELDKISTDSDSD
tara:strand:+ start:352 stop:774 length:423 start_codon:yes stop_codon:yes gene_type:complete